MKGRFFTLLVLVITLPACCSETWQFEDDVQLTVLEIEPDGSWLPGVVADTIRGPFRFSADGQYLLAAAAPIVRPAQILLAFSCDYAYDRVFDREAYELSVNQPILVAGRVVNAGSSLLPALSEVPLTDAYVSAGASGLQVGFLEGILASADIPKGDYTFTFTGTMEDGTVFTRTATVYLDL